MKELKDYTTDELKAEIKRRVAEERAQRRRETPYRAQYAYVTGTISDVSDDPFYRRRYELRIDDADIEKCNLRWRYRCHDIKLDSKRFRKENAPQIGDKVKVKSRISKQYPNGFGPFSRLIICDIINPTNPQ